MLLHISSDFQTTLSGQISGKFGVLSESKFRLGVTVSLPLSVFRSLFPCVYIYLFHNLCLFLCIFVYPNLFLLGVCASLSLFVCFFLSISRVVSVCLYVVLCGSMCSCRLFVSMLFASFCLFLTINIYLCLSFCLFALVFAGRCKKIINFHVVACRISPF